MLLFVSGFGVSEDRVPRKIVGARRQEVTGEWRRLRSEELPWYTRLKKLNENKSVS
jgi:hypothetical protein